MEKDKLIDHMTDMTGETVGSAVGAGIGTAIGGPLGGIAGAAAGSVLGNAFKFVADDIRERVLSKKEKTRIEKVLSLAYDKVSLNIADGKIVRDDYQGNSEAEEILEGTILNAQQEYEERKIPYIANLYANLAFDDSVPSSTINSLLKLTSSITFRQLQIISVIGFVNMASENLGLSLASNNSSGQVRGINNIGIASDIYDLYQKSILMSKTVIFDAAGIKPADLYIGGLGVLLYNHMELASMDIDNTYKEILEFISGKEIKEMDAVGSG